MRRVSLIVSVLLLFWINVSCGNKDEFDFEEGYYEGLFYRFDPNKAYEIANVSLLLNNNKFEGSSETLRYPLICEGTYKIFESEIEFINSCGPWTADFDWSLILHGESFKISKENNLLVLQRKYDFGRFDRYELQLK